MENHNHQQHQESDSPIHDLKTQRCDAAAAAAEMSSEKIGSVAEQQEEEGNLEEGIDVEEYEVRDEKGIEKCTGSLIGAVGDEGREKGADGVAGIVKEDEVLESGTMREEKCSNEESSSGVFVENEEKGCDGIAGMVKKGGVFENEEKSIENCTESSIGVFVENEEKGCDGIEGLVKKGGVFEIEEKGIENCKGSLIGVVEDEGREKGGDGVAKGGEVVESWTRRKEKGSESSNEGSSSGVDVENEEKGCDGIAELVKKFGVLENEAREERVNENYMGSLSGVVENDLGEDKGMNGIRGMVKDSESSKESSNVGEEKGRDGIAGMVKESEEKGTKGNYMGSLGGVVENEEKGMDGGYMGKDQQHPFPIRPEAEDCAFYMKTGTCKFGLNCKFNHPVKMKTQYYLRPGGSKFGNACKYNNTKGNTSSDQNPELNFLGLPIRLGEKECPYYMRTGSCKYGANCRFNHPDPTTIGSSEPSGTGKGGPVLLQGAQQANIASWSSPGTLSEAVPYLPVIFPTPPVVPSQSSDWNSYQVVYPPERGIHPSSAYAIKNPLNERNIYTHQQQQLPAEEFPERPGQPECSYYLRNGDCKFRSNCKYHHPKNRTPKSVQCALSDKGLPLRPGQNVCTYYRHYGLCKFGPACRYDHPINLTSDVAGENMPSVNSDLTTEGSDLALSKDRSEAITQ